MKTNKRLKVNCNKCKEDFTLLPRLFTRDLKYNYNGNNITIDYFICSKCKYKFVFNINDETTKEMNNSIQELALKIPSVPMEEKESSIVYFTELQNRLKEYVDNIANDIQNILNR